MATSAAKRTISFETITSNVRLRTRTERLDGREFIVAPLSLIVPGVLNGSKGALHYPPEEIERDPMSWNHMPIVVYHPEQDGQPVSARDPRVLEKQGIGYVYNTTYKKKLVAEGWFDVEKTRRISPGVLSSLRNGQAIELSTGLFTDNEPRRGTHNGRQYVAIARNYRPDHLAILPDKVGACSVQDGCGVLVNSTGRSVKKFVETLNAFCSTGKDGGQDNSCGSGGGGGAGGSSQKAHDETAKAMESKGRDDHKSAYVSHNKAASAYQNEAAKHPGDIAKQEPLLAKMFEHQNIALRHLSTLAGKDVTETGKHLPFHPLLKAEASKSASKPDSRFAEGEAEYKKALGEFEKTSSALSGLKKQRATRNNTSVKKFAAQLQETYS